MNTVKKLLVILLFAAALSSFSLQTGTNPYTDLYWGALDDFDREQATLLGKINAATTFTDAEKETIKTAIHEARIKLKAIDIWLRYLEPTNYKKINGPLPVEWENEVFEKFERPYKRTGAGLTLAEMYLDENDIRKDSLAFLISKSLDSMRIYREDSITSQLSKPDHFFFCNRLYLLNLAAIYTTGFDCPDAVRILPELRSMMKAVRSVYAAYNRSFPSAPLTPEYLVFYDKTSAWVNAAPTDFEQFDHFTFIKDYVNPLFALNQKMIEQYGVISSSFNDYSLNNTPRSVFDKSLYNAQNTKGVYSLVDDPATLAEVRAVGKQLFYDPIVSGNNARSCASCHKPKEYFTDTTVATALNFDRKTRLPRNTPTLINVVYQHLIMLDGKHTTLHAQALDVMTNATEMSGTDNEILEKILSCKEYKNAFKKLLKATPAEKEINMQHVISAITFYYGSFSNYYSPFDEAMNHNKPLGRDARNGFNIFMSKGKCATCHFVPQFNGVPPPYVGSEFEVIGTPADTGFTRPSEDKGRYMVNPAFETNGAFRTGTVRNAAHTKPYMHNGIFTTLDQLIDFYDAGGGAGRRLNVSNQTLPADSLRLTPVEKKELIAFIHSLSEKIIFEEPPTALPRSTNEALNKRKVGGEY